MLPVNYRLHEGTIVFRTGLHSSMVEDLRTGIAEAEYKVAFEIDQIRPATQEGWSVLIQGSAHFVESEAGLASLAQLGVQAWASGRKEQFIRIIPTHITGRRIRRAPEPLVRCMPQARHPRRPAAGAPPGRSAGLPGH